MTQFAIRHCRLFGVQRPSSGRRRRGENVLKSAEDSGRYSLQILLRPGVEAIERFFDVLDRVRHAEAKITLAEVAERGAGQCNDTCVFEVRVGQLFRWPSGLRRNL